MSLKLKLVVYFVLLSLLPLTAAFVGFNTVVQRSETRLADAGLEAALRASVAVYREEVETVERRAETLARSGIFQRLLADRDRRGIQRLLYDSRQLRVVSGDAFRVGVAQHPAVERRVDVVGPGADGAVLGTVVGSLALDAPLAQRLRARSGMSEAGRVVILRGGKIVAGWPTVGGELAISSGRPRSVEIGGRAYRALAAAAARGDDGTVIAVLTPKSEIDAAQNSARLRLLLALALCLVLVALVAYLEGRSIVRTLGHLVDASNRFARGHLSERVDDSGKDEFAILGAAFNRMAEQLESRVRELETERRRLKEATARFGEALSATHDVDQLLQAIVETAVDATGATGAVVLGRDGELVQTGSPGEGGQQFELPLLAGEESFGRLVLSGPSFTIQDLETAALLVGHAVVALENARLHRLLEHQALVDGLTGLANRRAAEETLALELSRAQRFGTNVALVFGDLDGFKSVNDRHGHPAGDRVLRQFAGVLRNTLRDIDIAARWGGEEFALILPGTDAEGAARLAERVRANLSARTILTAEGVPIRITSSFGVAVSPPAIGVDELVAAADAALYEAKRAGKDRVAVAAELAGHP